MIKSGPIATFNQFFLGLGWPWVGEFVGFTIKSTRFPTQHDLVYRKHTISTTQPQHIHPNHPANPTMLFIVSLYLSDVQRNKIFPRFTLRYPRSFKSNYIQKGDLVSYVRAHVCMWRTGRCTLQSRCVGWKSQILVDFTGGWRSRSN